MMGLCVGGERIRVQGAVDTAATWMVIVDLLNM